MRIVMATHYFGSHRGGIEIVAERLYEELSALGQNVTWIANSSAPPSDEIDGSRTVCLPAVNIVEEKTGLPFPIPTIRALRILRREVEQADVVILHDCLYLSNIAAFLMARMRRIPTLIVQHIGLVPYRSRLLKMLMSSANTTVSKPMLSRAAQVVFISNTTKEFFAGLPFRTPPEVIFNGVDCKTFQASESKEAQADLRSKYNLPLDTPIALFVGRFVEKKGLRVLKEMAAARPNYTWIFAGWGPLDPRGWKAKNVRVFSDLRGASLADIYRASDLLVLPSTGEGLPLVLQEALASGLPVVCGNDTARADPAMTALVRSVPVYPEDHQRTAKEFLVAIDGLVLDCPRGAQSDARRAFAMTRYSWTVAARRYLELVSRLVEGSGSVTSSRFSVDTGGE